MTPIVTSTVAQRAKHPCGRRNTLIHPYVRHGLGFSTAEWEESLTVKFRNLPSRERRLYTLSLGYGLRDDNNNGGTYNKKSVKRKRRAEMTRDHAVTLMARFHEMLLHGGRTVEGIFAALGVEASYVDVRQYSMALEHISAREGTGIPTGAAEQALAFLHRHGEEVWPFLAQHLAGTEQKQSDHVVDVSQAPARYSDEAPSAGNDNRLREKDGVVVQRKRDRGNKQAAPVNGDEEAAYTLDQVSAALEMFGRERHTRGDAVGELAFRDLNNYLYLGGQTKITVAGLKAVAEKYGRWALQRNRREARAAKTRLAEAATSAAAGKAFFLTEEQLDAAVDFLDPNKDGSIDPNELMQALKQERTAKAILSKDGVDRGQKQQRSKNTSSSSSSGDDVDKKKLVGDAQSPEKAAPKPSPGEDGHSDSTSEAEQIAELGGGQRAVMAGEKRPEKEERPLFSLAEVESLTAYLVESQQAASLVNVADIQHGMRGAKRADAQAETRDVHRRTAKRLAAELRAAGVELESNQGWERWFDTCELGLRAGGEEGARRLVGRNELRRGLKALSAATRSNAGISEQHRGGGTAGSVQEDAWSEQDIDTLLYGLDLLSSGEAGDVVSDGSGDDSPIKRSTELTDVEFREKMMLAIAEGGTKVDRDLSSRKSMLPLFERLQAYMKDRGMRMGQLFELMVAWAKDAPEENFMPPTTQANPRVLSPATSARRGDESCVPPSAFRAVLLSLKTGGLTGAERAKVKADENTAKKAEEDKKAAQGMTDEAARRMVAADESGASMVLALLRESIASKSIRVAELFNAMDTSKDGLISRRDSEELKEGLEVIAKASVGKSLSFEQARKECRKRRQLATALNREEEEKRGSTKLRTRIMAADGSGATKVLRRINEHLARTGLKVMDSFNSFTLRDNLNLTMAEFEMAVSLIDGLDLTRREVRSVSRFLDKDSSGVIDVTEVDKAVREFRQLSRDMPSIGTGPMTVIDLSEVERLAKRSFSDMLTSRDNDQITPPDGAQKGVGVGQEKEAREEDGQGQDEGRGGVGEGLAATVSVSEITAAFEEAFRQFKAGASKEEPAGARWYPAAQHPPADAQYEQASADKVAEWLRSSRTFGRAPTGRVPPLAEQMSDRQRMEAELRNKLQEKRRRAAGQRHWEEWVARKARGCKDDRHDRPTDDGASGGGGGRSGRRGDAEAARRRRQERADAELRKREQDDAFAAWVREKDKALRARRREKRRAMASNGPTTIQAINSKIRDARLVIPNRCVRVQLPRLIGRSDIASHTSSAHTIYGSLTPSPGSKGGKHTIKVLSKAERKALGLAVTRVAVSPYRVRPHEPYQHDKHIEGGNIVTRMARKPLSAFSRALVREGWEATSLLLGSASMSLID
ncbi:unnamed protein product, partial [Laminaria digitata]